MNRLLSAIAGLSVFTATGQAAINTFVDYAELMRNRIFGVTVVGILALLLGYIFNIAGFKEINFLFSLIFMAATAWIFSRPRWCIYIAWAGALKEGVINGTPLSGAEKALGYYAKFVGNVLIFGAVLFSVLAVIPFEASPFAVISMTVLVITIVLMNVVWNIGPTISKKMMMAFIVIALIINAFGLIPRASWIKMTGYDLKGWADVSESERALSNLEETEAELADMEAARRIRAIEKKVKAGIALTEEEEAFLEWQKAKRDSNTVPAKLSEVFNDTPTQTQLVWQTVFKQTYVGRGYGESFHGYIPDTPHFGVDVRDGDKIIVTGAEFEYRHEGWHRYNDRKEVVNHNTDNSKIVGIKAPTGIEVTLEIQRLTE